VLIWQQNAATPWGIQVEGDAELSGSKGIDDGQVVECEVVLEVFRIEGGTTVGVCGGDDGAIPMGEAVATPQCGGVENECVGQRLERKVGGELE